MARLPKDTVNALAEFGITFTEEPLVSGEWAGGANVVIKLQPRYYAEGRFVHDRYAGAVAAADSGGTDAENEAMAQRIARLLNADDDGIIPS